MNAMTKLEIDFAQFSELNSRTQPISSSREVVLEGRLKIARRFNAGSAVQQPSPEGSAEGSQGISVPPSLRDAGNSNRPPGVETPGYSQSSLRDERLAASAEGTTESLPQIPLVEFNPVFPQQRQELLLKRLGAVVLRLVFDVLRNRLQLRNAHAQRAVFFLPREKPLVRKRLVYPLGRAALDQLHRLGN